MSSLLKSSAPSTAAESLPSRSDALSARYGQAIEDLSIDQALAIISVATFISHRDRAVFWARDGSSILDPESGALKPLNEVIVERFVREANQKLGYAPWRDGLLSGDHAIYHTMHSLPEGRALWRLTRPGPDQPAKVIFQGRTFGNDSFSSTEALLEHLAGEYARQASGEIHVGVVDAEPDCFFRRREVPLLTANVRITRVHALDFQAEQHPEDLAQSDPSNLKSTHFAGPAFRLVRRTFDSAAEWIDWQRDQWLQASLGRLRPHLDPSAGVRQRIAGLTVDQDSGNFDRCRARFLCEAHTALQAASSLPRDGGYGDPAESPEARRLATCAALLCSHPPLLEPLTDLAAADTFSRFIVRQEESNLAARDALLDRLWSDPNERLGFAAEAALRLGSRIDEQAGVLTRGGRR